MTTQEHSSTQKSLFQTLRHGGQEKWNSLVTEITTIRQSANPWRTLCNSRLMHYVYIIILVVVAGFLLFWNLGGRSLQHWDEGIYALIADDLQKQPSLTLSLNQTVWMEKPPLGFFIEAIFIAIFGFSEWAIRLASSIYVFISVFLVYAIGKELRNTHLGFLAAFLTIISPALIGEHMARSGDLDSGLLLFSLLAFYLLIKSTKHPKFLFWSGLAAGLGIMIRGSSGVFIVIITGVYIVLAGLSKNYSWKQYAGYVGAVLGVVLPWHIHQLIVHGQAFWDVYVMEHFLSRIVTPIQNHAGKWDYYFMYFRWKHNLLHYLFWVSLLYAGWKIIVQRKKEMLLPVVWFLVTLAPLMLMQTKLWWYGITLIPAMMLLLSDFAIDLVKRKNRVLLLAVNTFMVWVWLFDPKINNYLYSDKRLVLAVGLTLLVAIFWGLVATFRCKQAFLTVSFSAFFVVFFIGNVVTHLRADYRYVMNTTPDPIEQLADVLGQDAPGGVDLVVFHTQDWVNGWILPASDYYLSRVYHNRIHLIAADNRAYFIDNDQYQYLLTNTAGLEQMNAQRPDAYTLFPLYAHADLVLVKKILQNQ